MAEKKRQESDKKPTLKDGTRGRAYARPALTEYGSISKLTQSGTGSVMEGTKSNKRTTTCL